MDERKKVLYHKSKEGYHVGQKGDFWLHDSFKQPIEKVRGEIVSLMEGKDSLYAMLRTERGLRPGRLG
jgi:hypothetical protein